MSKAKGASRGRNHASCRSSARKAAVARGFPTLQQGDLGEIAFVHKAMSLGFVVAKPYGNIHRYDFIVEGGRDLWRVQVKNSTFMRGGSYQLCVRRCINGGVLAYTESELDFVVAYIIPENAWYVLPVREVVGHKSLRVRPKGLPREDPYARYREAWHLLGEPDSPAL